MAEVVVLEPRPGSYILWLQLTSRRTVAVGKLGEALFEPGTYGYVGSALGPGGVRARLGRHLRQEKRMRWHIDYLRAVATVRGAWVLYGKKRREHDLAQALLGFPGHKIPLDGFGASDCSCKTHLIGFCRPVTLRRFQREFGSGAASIRVCLPDL